MLTEDDLLAFDFPLLLTGDPGAGKTTTIKRLCRRLLTEAPSPPADTSSYPVLIECRSHDWAKVSLVDVLYEATGFPETDGSRIAAVADFLNDTGAHVFVDGLDEVTYKRGAENHRRRLERDVQALGHHLRAARIMVSCRSGSAPDFDNYQALELCPLTDGQIEQVVRAQLGEEAASFMEALASSPIRDVATRPLLLSQVIILFQLRGGQMPNRPAVLYRKLIKLLLEEWDEKRQVARPSKYAGFGPDEKMDFLSELSYRLTINGSIRFPTDELVAIYEEICERFGLPSKEARKVAKEIETHNGLIVASGDMYEFSHLSLQEYLCADHIVRVPNVKRLGQYLDRYPEAVAVAVAISSEPTTWLTQVVNKKEAFQRKDAVRAFVHRLGREQPGFSAHLDLGHSMLRLMFSIADDDVSAFAPLAEILAVRQSLAEAVQHYEHSRAPAGLSLRYVGAKDAGRAYTPGCGRISKALWELMLPGVEPKMRPRS